MDNREWRYALAAFGLALLARVGLIATHPTMYSMDAYQRWGGRAHLLVQDWLPATQFIVWLTTSWAAARSRREWPCRSSQPSPWRRAVSVLDASVAPSQAGPSARRRLRTSLTWTACRTRGTFMLLFGGMALALRALGRARRCGARLCGPTWPSAAWWSAAGLARGLLYILWRRDRRAAIAHGHGHMARHQPVSMATPPLPSTTRTGRVSTVASSGPCSAHRRQSSGDWP